MLSRFWEFRKTLRQAGLLVVHSVLGYRKIRACQLRFTFLGSESPLFYSPQEYLAMSKFVRDVVAQEIRVLPWR